MEARDRCESAFPPVESLSAIAPLLGRGEPHLLSSTHPHRIDGARMLDSHRIAVLPLRALPNSSNGGCPKKAGSHIADKHGPERSASAPSVEGVRCPR